MTAPQTPLSSKRSLSRLKELRAEQVTVGYRDVVVLRDASVTLGAGEHVGLVGPNGSGKSSLLKCLSGLLTPRAGRIVSGELVITRWSAGRRRREGIALVPEGRRVFPSLTVEETLLLAHRALGARKGQLRSAVAADYERFPSLGTRRHVTAGLLSGGEQQMLCLARAMAGNPSILLVDEPFMGLAPTVVSAIVEEFRSLAQTGVGMLIADESRTTLERLHLHRIIDIDSVTASATPRPCAGRTR